jgi:hypothetical protein
VRITKNCKFFIILFNFDVKNSIEGNRGIHKALDNRSHITNAHTYRVVNGSVWCTTWQIPKKKKNTNWKRFMARRKGEMRTEVLPIFTCSNFN